MADPLSNDPAEAVAGLHHDFAYVALFYRDAKHIGTAGGMDLDDVRAAIRSRILMELGKRGSPGLQYRVIDRTGEKEVWCDPSVEPDEQHRWPLEWRFLSGYMNAGIRIEGGLGDRI